MPKLFHVTTVTHTLHFLIGQISFMQQSGMEVHAVSSVNPTGDEKLDFFRQHENVEHHPVEISRSLTPVRDLISTWSLFRLFRKHKPEIVHAHTPKAGLVAILASFLAGVPVRVYHIHGLRFSTLTGWKRMLVIACEKLTCKLATRVLCVSRSAKAEAVVAGLARHGNIRVLKSGSINGLDATGRFDPDSLPPDAGMEVRNRLGIAEDDVVIGFIGRLVRDKGIEELVDAWKTVGSTRIKQQQAHLLLVGDYESQDPVSDETKRLIESDWTIHRLDYDPETPKLYAAMDVFCLPSYREGLPYVALEAAAMRLPVITTNATGCVDGVEDGITGTCVSVGRSDALAAAIKRYTYDRGLRLWHGNAGRRRILQEFRPAAIWEATLAEYCELLSSSNCDLPASGEVRKATRPEKVA